MTITPERVPGVAPVHDISGPKWGQWTYKEYAALPNDGQRYEIIDGVLFVIPSPGMMHQQAAFEIATYLRQYVNAQDLGRVFIAPLDVELAPNVVVQPDILVLLKENFDKIVGEHVVGAPDLVVEVLSPGTATYDRRGKYDAYARAGVPEYWIVDPHIKTVELFTLDRHEYQSGGIFQGKAILPSQIVPGIDVAVEQFFL